MTQCIARHLTPASDTTQIAKASSIGKLIRCTELIRGGEIRYLGKSNASHQTFDQPEHHVQTPKMLAARQVLSSTEKQNDVSYRDPEESEKIDLENRFSSKGTLVCIATLDSVNCRMAARPSGNLQPA